MNSGTEPSHVHPSRCNSRCHRNFSEKVLASTSWCAWVAWEEKDTEEGKEAGAAGGDGSPAPVPHSS